ncbi:fimbrial protein [Providencia hangzhouensis]|uniref:fimbrial protein n=1 Tax=Providencia hangzhouensis TaxID=3031799 RepID=UPI0034DD1877
MFTGVNDTIMTNLLKNLDETDAGASNIAIGIYDNNKKIIDISNNKTTLKIDHNLVNNIFNFYSSYIKTGNTSSAGKVLCIANFELSYD